MDAHFIGQAPSIEGAWKTSGDIVDAFEGQYLGEYNYRNLFIVTVTGLPENHGAESFQHLRDCARAMVTAEDEYGSNINVRSLFRFNREAVEQAFPEMVSSLQGKIAVVVPWALAKQFLLVRTAASDPSDPTMDEFRAIEDADL
jgi:hypothetical protein